MNYDKGPPSRNHSPSKEIVVLPRIVAPWAAGRLDRGLSWGERSVGPVSLLGKMIK